MLAVKVLISTKSQDSGIGIIQYVHSLIGLKDIHVSKRDVDNNFGIYLIATNHSRLKVVISTVYEMRHAT